MCVCVKPSLVAVGWVSEANEQAPQLPLHRIERRPAGCCNTRGAQLPPPSLPIWGWVLARSWPISLSSQYRLLGGGAWRWCTGSSPVRAAQGGCQALDPTRLRTGPRSGRCCEESPPHFSSADHCRCCTPRRAPAGASSSPTGLRARCPRPPPTARPGPSHASLSPTALALQTRCPSPPPTSCPAPSGAPCSPMALALQTRCPRSQGAPRPAFNFASTFTCTATQLKPTGRCGERTGAKPSICSNKSALKSGRDERADGCMGSITDVRCKRCAPHLLPRLTRPTTRTSSSRWAWRMLRMTQTQS